MQTFCQNHYSIRRFSSSARRRNLPDVSLILFKTVQPLQQQRLGQRVDPLRRKVEDSHRRDHEDGPGVAPARHLHGRLEVVFDLVQLQVDAVALDVVHRQKDCV